MSHDPNDDRLALDVHEHVEGAFERLVRTYETQLFNYVVRMLQNAHDAQEVVQDTFIRCHKALTRQYDIEKCRSLAVRPWLFRIARNLAHNKRRGKRHQVEMQLSDDDAIESRRATTDPSAICRIEKKEDLEQLDQAISLLPDESRELIVLRFIDELSYSEIAETTGQSEAALRGKVFRAIRLLRQTMAVGEVSHAM